MKLLFNIDVTDSKLSSLIESLQPDDLLLNPKRAPSSEVKRKRLLAYNRLMAELISYHLDELPPAYHQMSKSAFGYAPIRYDIFNNVVKSCEKAGLIKREVGHRKDGESVATTFNLTDEVLRRIETWRQSREKDWSDVFVALEIQSPLVRAKYPRPPRRGRIKPQAKEVPQEKLLKREDIQSQWRRIDMLNHFYRKHPIKGVPFNGLQRIFNNYSDNQDKPLEGGRLYAIGGSYQTLKSSLRTQLKIDNEDVCEIDIKSSHLVLTSFIKRATSSNSNFLNPSTLDDPYYFEGIPRPVVKAIITLLLGSDGSTRTWTSDQRKDLMEKDGINLKDYSFKEIKSIIEESYGFITGAEGQAISWGLLQNREADALLSCITRLAHEYDIAAYPVHDSIIVKQGDSQVASRVLVESFRSNIGYEPRLSIKYSN